MLARLRLRVNRPVHPDVRAVKRLPDEAVGRNVQAPLRPEELEVYIEAHLRAGQPGLILKALGQPLRPRWVGAFGPEMTSNLWYASGVALGATTMFQSCMESLTELWLACGTEEGK